MRMMQTKFSEDDRVTKLEVHWFVNIFQQTGSVEYFQHNNNDIIFLKKRRDVIRTQIGLHFTDLMYI